MLTFEEAKATIVGAVSTLGRETMLVRQSLGRVLARPLVTPCDFPAARISAVDGFALGDREGGPYREVAVVAAGESLSRALQPGECAAVMTGGMVPENTCCVVKVEEVEATGASVRVPSVPDVDAFINAPGSECVAGTIFLEAGRRLTKAAYPAVFYAGIRQVDVYRRPRVGMLITGAEVREVEQGHAPGQVFNTNQYILESLLHGVGLSCDVCMKVGEDAESTRAALLRLVENCDVVVTSGGVSRGRSDHLQRILQDPPFRVLVNRTAIRPGSPLVAATWGERIVFGMPGYPAAFMTNAMLYLVPALKRQMGLQRWDHQWITATLQTPLHSKRGRVDVCRVELRVHYGRWEARGGVSQTTSRFLAFANTDGLAVLSEGVGDLGCGDCVPVLHFDVELS